MLTCVGHTLQGHGCLGLVLDRVGHDLLLDLIERAVRRSPLAPNPQLTPQTWGCCQLVLDPGIAHNILVLCRNAAVEIDLPRNM